MQQNDLIESISVIGAGNVGWHLSQALHKAGYRIKHIVSRNRESAGNLPGLVNAQWISSLDKVADEPDIYLVSVQDDHIREVAESLSSSSKIAVHTAGGINMDVFNLKQSRFGVFYPLQTFTRSHPMDWSKIHFLLEANEEETLAQLKGMAEKISGRYNSVPSETRKKVHLAAIFACNFGNHMTAIADYLLSKEGLEIKILLPLLEESLRKLKTMSPKDAQTGPARRNDEATLKQHIELLETEPELKEVYKLISQHIINNS